MPEGNQPELRLLEWSSGPILELTEIPIYRYFNSHWGPSGSLKLGGCWWIILGVELNRSFLQVDEAEFPCSGSWNNIKTHSGHDISLATRWRRSRYTNIWLTSLWENSDCAVLPGWDCWRVGSLWDRPLCHWGRTSGGSREHWSLFLEKLRMFGYPRAHLVPHFLCNIHDCLYYYFSEVFLIYQCFPILALHQNHLVGGGIYRNRDARALHCRDSDL